MQPAARGTLWWRALAWMALATVFTATHWPNLQLDLPMRGSDKVLHAVAFMALALVWRLWGRSGDAAIDAMYEQGMELMQAGNLPKAVLVFSDIITQRPAFAEAWNKRATLYFMLDQYELSMKDCDEVLKRNPMHFGALSGMAQIHLRRGDPERALQAWERALQINPNLEGGPQLLQLLEEAVRRRGSRRS